MNFEILKPEQDEEISDLFRSTFTASEGEREGKLIGTLTRELANGIDDAEIIGIASILESKIVGCIFFTMLKVDDPLLLYMLAPVAVSTEFQRKGIGQSLINYGFGFLLKRDVDTVVTYGDPAYYSKVGFQPLLESTLAAPHKLSMPFGWQGKSLTQNSIPIVKARPKCVSAFDNPALW